MKKVVALILVLFSLKASYAQDTIYNVKIPINVDSIQKYSRLGLTVTGTGGTYNSATGLLNLTGGGAGSTGDSTKKNTDSIFAHNTRIMLLTTNLGINTASDAAAAAKARIDSIAFQQGLRRSSYPAGLVLTQTVYFDGNSIMGGYNASSTSLTIWNLVSKATGVTASLTAAGGSGFREAILRQFTREPAFNAPNSTMWEVGVNDARNVSTNKAMFSGAFEAYKVLLSNLWMDTTIAIASSYITKAGTWTNLTTSNISSKSVIKMSAVPIQTSVAGSTLSFPWQANNLVIGTWGVEGTHTAFGRFTVSDNGNVIGTYDVKNKGFDYNQSGTLDIRMPNVVVIFLTPGKHNIVITALDNLEIDFDYIGRLGSPSRVPSAVMMHVNYSNYTAYAGGFNNIQRVDTLNQIIDSAHRFFADKAYPVDVVRVENYLDTATDMSSDGLHPADIGYYKLAKAVISKLSMSTNLTGYVDTLTNQNVAGDKNFTGNTTLTSLATVVSKSATENNGFVTELATGSGSGGNWTTATPIAGTTHTAGAATAYVSPLAATSGGYYRLGYTISAWTTGTVNITYGGDGVNNLGGNFSGEKMLLAVSTAVLTFTPTSTFDGTVTVSIKVVNPTLSPAFILKTSDLSTKFGIVTPAVNTFGIGTGNFTRLFATGTNNMAVGNGNLLALGTALQTIALGHGIGTGLLNSQYFLGVGYQAGTFYNDGSTLNRGSNHNDYIGANTRTGNSTTTGANNEHVLFDGTQGRSNNSTSIGDNNVQNHWFNAGTVHVPNGTTSLAPLQLGAYYVGILTTPVKFSLEKDSSGTGGYFYYTLSNGVRLKVNLSTMKQYQASGTGAATTISIPHGLTGVTSATPVSVGAMNAASAGWSYYTVDATNVNIVYPSAPGSGTNNLLYTISINLNP